MFRIMWPSFVTNCGYRRSEKKKEKKTARRLDVIKSPVTKSLVESNVIYDLLKSWSRQFKVVFGEFHLVINIF